MTHDPDSTDEPADRPGRLSQNGLMACIGVYGSLVLVGFFFGVVAGYESPKTGVVTKAPKEKEREAPRPAPKAATPAPQPTAEPKEEPKPEVGEPGKEEPKPEPKPEPKAVEPAKPEPKKVEPAPATVAVSFQRDVLPIFRTYCFDCHGSPKQDYGIDLRTLASIMKGGENGAILVPNEPGKSSVYLTVEDNTMPKRKEKVPPRQQLIIKNWILGGAKPRRRPVRRR